MIIKELNLTHFGKFHQQDIELGPRMNIIYGSNEAGKSTVHGFIGAMLFGVRRMRGRAAASDMYTRYQPWESKTSYEGTMIFEYEGKNYRIYRNFYKEEQAVHLIELDSGREVGLPGGTISDLIPGLTEENYKNTISISQMKSSMDDQFSLSLQSYAANMTMTGASNLHLGRALDYLRQEKRRLSKTSAADEIAELNEKIAGLEASVNGSHNDDLRGRYEKALEELRERRQRLSKQQSESQVSEGMLLMEEQQLNASLARVQADIRAVQAALRLQDNAARADRPLPQPSRPQTAGLQSSGSQGIGKQPWGSQPAHPQPVRPDPLRHEPPADENNRGALPKVCLAIIALCIIAALAAIFLRDALPSGALYAILAICIVGLGIVIIGGVRAFGRGYGRERNLRESSDAGPTGDAMADWLRRNPGEGSDTGPTDDALADELRRSQRESSQDELARTLASHTQTEASLVRQLKAVRQKRSRLNEQKAALAERILQIDKEYENYRQLLEKCNWEQEKKYELSNTLEGCRESLEHLQRNEQQLRQELDCVQTAQDIIESLSGEIHENFGTQLNASVERMMQEITGDRRKFTLSREFRIAVDNSRDYVDMDRLSTGTVDQLYLSLRINAAGILFGQRTMPLILDDTFAYYDDSRLQAILKWLMENYTGQIILLTCHRREGDLLDAMDYDYNYVNLSESASEL